MNSEVFTDSERARIELVKNEIKVRLRSVLSYIPTTYLKYFEYAILTGGAITSLFHGEEPNDWDFYLNDMIQINGFQDILMNDSYTIENLVLDVNPNYRTTTVVEGKYVTENAVTFKNKLQVITNNCSSARESFDFIHCMPYYRTKENKFYISRAQYDAIEQRKLVQNPKFTTQPSIRRIQKFQDRGWKLI